MNNLQLAAAIFAAAIAMGAAIYAADRAERCPADAKPATGLQALFAGCSVKAPQ